MAASANGKAVDYYSNGVLEESQARDLEKLVAAAVKNDCKITLPCIRSILPGKSVQRI
jgi:hypothetical protein